MKFSTLAIIEQALRNEVADKEKHLGIIDEKLEPLYLKEDSDTLDDSEKADLKYWRERRTQIFGILTDARCALDDFLDHDWH